MSHQSTGADVNEEVTISYMGAQYGEWLIVSPVTFAAAKQLLLGLEGSEIESGLVIGDVPKDPTKFDEFLFAVRIRAINDNSLVLEHLNRYFGVSLPDLKGHWQCVCVGKN
ncbi:hypothetical protein [Phytobacter sp. MRY16-398]|uniref:hypothetical protein n=1 Tax=Phytobacter sp. MRY16-398 TaxID=2487150 RepID=UPI000DF5FDE3|nr:hypothetical protein [Phytobacter sp. MRY16-398]UKL15118.1 hypothetical protein [Elizabethkingia phage EKP1]BBE80235.1 hypothetical protein MRY16398_52910 [Phytobacter sp. MRY16-398]